MTIEITVAILAGILGTFFLYKAISTVWQDTKDEHERYNDRISATVNKTGGSSLTVNLNKKYNLYDYNFPELMKQRYMREHKKSEADYELVQLALKDWFSIFTSTNRAEFYDFPSREVDELWHTFILFTKDYREFCQNYLGQFLDHVPLENKNIEYPNLKNLVRTFDTVKNKNDGLLFKIDDMFNYKDKNKYNYDYMRKLEQLFNKSSKSRTTDEGSLLYNYGLISYSESRAMFEPEITNYSSTFGSSYSSKSSSSKSSSSKSSSKTNSSYESSCSSSCGSASSCGSSGCGS